MSRRKIENTSVISNAASLHKPSVLRIAFYGFAGMAITLLIVFSLSFVAFSLYPLLPSDAVLISRLREKKPYFTKLLRMVQEDRKLVTPSYWWGIPEARGEEYKELLRVVGVGRIVPSSDGKQNFFFSVANRMSGEEKGYAHLVTSPRFLTASLDDHTLLGFWYENRNNCNMRKYVFRDIGDGWYLCRVSQVVEFRTSDYEH